MADAAYASYRPVGGLRVHPILAETVEKTICPGTGFSADYFWSCLANVVEELTPQVHECLGKRDEFQQKIDEFYKKRKADGILSDSKNLPECLSYLREIGYIVPDGGPVSISTANVDPELASVPAPQLVVPSDNARYVLNAVNARWTSLFDALYGFDVIPEIGIQRGAGKPAAGYNPLRGQAVIKFANTLLDEIVPLESGLWSEVLRLWPRQVGGTQQLEIQMKQGISTGLKTPSAFVGSSGSLGPPMGYNTNETMRQIRQVTSRISDKGRIFLKHNGLHMILEIDGLDPIGKTSVCGMKDITMESALTAILDMEDSVAAVDAADKSRLYTNIAGVFKGTLSAPLVKKGKAVERRMNPDIPYRDQHGRSACIPGRVVALIRNVGHHMFTDAVITAKDSKPIPEGFLDCMVTVAAAIHDLRGSSQLINSRTGSIYIVKPKQHGPAEVALTNKLFGRAEEYFGLQRNTIKMGVMDEERRTSVNLRECIRACSERIMFINTGFLDRTGDEIHTCMYAGPVVRKAHMKQQPWIKAYENSNVDIGLAAGMQGKGQIGKGMWAKPDSMKAMLDAKIAEPMNGASTAWVPSPTAATLHAIHYHRVDVNARQPQLAMRPAAKVETICEPPLLTAGPTAEDVALELKENSQSILGYVVRWVNQGVGCSKVPDLDNVGLMEDRATLRISSQILANWLQHGRVSEQQIRDAFAEMAKVVDSQNASDREYSPMAPNLESSIAYHAALRLVFDGRKSPNGYTEPILHEARRQVKAKLAIPGSRL